MKKRVFNRRAMLSAFLAAMFITAVCLPGFSAHTAEARYPADMEEETAMWIQEAGEALREIAAERDIMALIYLADEYPVRCAPSYDSETAVTVLSGQQVIILDIFVDDTLQVWEYVRLEYQGAEYYGYVPRTYLAVSDSRFLRWEEYYGMNPEAGVYEIDGGQTVYQDILQFPASYQTALLALKQQHPNWIFAKMNTGLDWQSVIECQLQGERSLVYKTLPDWAKDGLYDTGNWYYATEAAVKVYMDPRNGLTEQRIFQFEQLTYNEEYHTLEAVRKFLERTFMNDNRPVQGAGGMTFAEMFWNIGREKGREVSPFHLAARVLQEQGQGDSPLISGVYPGYEGCYNYFNIGAAGKTDQEVYESGLRYAREHGWTDTYTALSGGADFISGNYIRKGQDTLYLQKYNVNPNGAYPVHTHQYMQNISAPASEASSIRRLYESAGALDSTFVFKIPVYTNMPEQPCTEPGKEPSVTESLQITLDLPAGYGEGTVWLDGRAFAGSVQDGKVTVTADDRNLSTAVMYRYNGSGVPTGMYVWSLRYRDGAYTAVPEPGLEDLLTYHGFSIRITGKSGIRFKTGISSELRQKLTSGGVNGYRLTEYGTLVMSNANMERYPMIKGGTKVQTSMAYGADGNGGFTDVVFETADGRYRYTSVLVGMPAAQYKTEFAFRGYAVLEKSGKEFILYGPPVAKSVYSLAEQLLERGSYEQGSEAYEFLKKLIYDADVRARD